MTPTKKNGPVFFRLPPTQILLPPSAGASLMDQNAYKNGPMFFRLTSPHGTVTHAGVLEFSAAEGFVALPRKVGPGGVGGRGGGELQNGIWGLQVGSIGLQVGSAAAPCEQGAA